MLASLQTIFSLLVLGHLMQGMLSAFLVLAVCLLRLWNVHLEIKNKI
ncbi:hypothetical protein HanIR_Chr12g0566231 [Helianthus annuus]|nr:hypothetical protein HanIR_Chr12g0566231 [Helianthus annuus]